ncbi:MAG: IS110 family transposase [Actinobacteria bacterium]|nr:IS110 family transposase [Actinomycetota bacterium]
MVFLGVDWAEEHHDICLIDSDGKRLEKARVPEGIDGVRHIHALVAKHIDEPGEVVVGIETDRGLLVGSLVGAGYQVFAINPLAVSRYRDRHTVSRAKSDHADALLLAELVRTDRHNHRQVRGDTAEALAIRVIARAHQGQIAARQRQANQLRSALREFYPAALRIVGTDLDSKLAVALLAIAPTPAQGRKLSRAQIRSALSRGGLQRNLDEKAAEIQQQLRAEQLEAPAPVARAFGAIVAGAVKIIRALNEEIEDLETELTASFEAHPDAEIIRSLPGLGVVLGARALGEFGDDHTRYADAKSRKNYAGTSPITKASGKQTVVLARFVRNRHLADALYLWSFCSLTQSPGARAYYDAHRARGANHHQALRALGNRWVGVLHGCLRHRQNYSEDKTWGLVSLAA